MCSKSEAIKRKRVGDLEFRVTYDRDPINPREDCDGYITLIAGWHRRYGISDLAARQYKTPEEFLADRSKTDIVFPLYMFNHGGLDFSTEPFSDPWDSGRVGYVAVTQKACEAAGIPFGDAERVQKCVTEELEDFTTYMNGHIFEMDVHRVIDDSCLETPIEGAYVSDIWSDADDYLDETVHQLTRNLDGGEEISRESISSAQWEW